MEVLPSASSLIALRSDSVACVDFNDGDDSDVVALKYVCFRLVACGFSS